jgi:hypothetical protein
MIGVVNTPVKTTMLEPTNNSPIPIFKHQNVQTADITAITIVLVLLFK